MQLFLKKHRHIVFTGVFVHNQTYLYGRFLKISEILAFLVVFLPVVCLVIE